MDIRNIPHSCRNQPMKMVELSLKDYEEDFLDKLTFLEKEMRLSSLKNLKDLCQYFDKDESFIVKMLNKIKVKEIIDHEYLVLQVSQEMTELLESEDHKEKIEDILNKTSSVQGLTLDHPFNLEEKIKELEEEDKRLIKKLDTATDSEEYFDLIERKIDTVRSTYICLMSRKIESMSQLNLTKGFRYASLILQNEDYQRALMTTKKQSIIAPEKTKRKLKNTPRNKTTRRMDMKLKKGS